MFVECLLRRGDLKSRLDRIMAVANKCEMGFTNFIVVLGEWNTSDTTAAARGEM